MLFRRRNDVKDSLMSHPAVVANTVETELQAMQLVTGCCNEGVGNVRAPRVSHLIHPLYMHEQACGRVHEHEAPVHMSCHL